MGIANPIPWPPLIIAVLIPTTSPRVLRSGPPEFPGLIDASVWIRSPVGSVPGRSTRPVALITPRGPVLGAVGKPDDDLVGVPDDVLVRDDEPVLADDDAGPEGVLPKPSVLFHQFLEIILHGRTAPRSGARGSPRKAGAPPDGHHRGGRPLAGGDEPLLHPGGVRRIDGRPARAPGAGRQEETPGHCPRAGARY